MSIVKYRYLRNYKLYADTLEKECDSLQALMTTRLVIKDSIIQVQKNKLVLKDTIIAEKNKTIKEIGSAIGKQPKIVVPLIIAVVAEFFLLILAIK